MELDQARIANTAANTKALLAMLDEKQLKYTVEEQTDARAHIRIGFVGNDIPMTLHIILRTDRQLATVFSPMPFTFPLDRISEGAEAVTAANYGLIDGSFDLDMETGEIRFRLTSSYLGSVLSEELFSYLMFVSAETIDRYNDRFFLLSSGQLPLADFVRMDAEDRGAVR